MLMWFLSILSCFQMISVPVNSDPVISFKEEKLPIEVTVAFFEEGPYLVQSKQLETKIFKNEQLIITIPVSLLQGIISGDYGYYYAYENSNYYLYIINLKLALFQKVAITMSTVNGILIVNNHLWLLGGEASDAYIVIYNLNGGYLRKYQYGGSGKEEFTSGYYDGEYLYLAGLKDAHSLNSCFKNVGSLGEQKSFIVKLSDEGKIVDVIYFNEQTSFEKIMHLSAQSKYLTFSLELSDGRRTMFILDKNLHIIKKKMTSNQVIPLLSSKSEQKTWLYAVLQQDEIIVKVDEKVLFNISGKLLGIKIANATIIIYLEKSDGSNQRVTLNEYHINKIEPLICHKLYYDLKTTSHLDVDSYLEDLTFQLVAKEPYFELTKSGKYTGTYQAFSQSGQIISVTSDIIVKDFVNVIEGGVYKQGTILTFFGEAILNGNKAINGEKLQQLGENTLIITNNQNESVIYLFYVVDDYYKENDHFNIEADYNLVQNDYLDFAITLPEIKNLAYITVNQKPYELFEVSGDQLIVTFYASHYYDLQSYTIDSISYYDNDLLITVMTNYNFIIRTLKEKPTININLENQNNLITLNLNIDDNDQTIIDFYLAVDLDGEEYSYEYIFLKNYRYSLNKKHLNKNIKINGYLLCELGHNIVQKIPIFIYEAKYTGRNWELINVAIEPIKGSLTKMTISFNLYAGKLQNQQLLVGQTSLRDFNNKTKNAVILYLTAGITIASVITMVLLVVLRKKYRRLKQ